MAIEEMFTELPTVANSTLGDIICAVQGYVSPSALGTSTQQTLQQVYDLFKSSIVQFNAGNPNGSVAGTTYEFCWDTVNNMLWICTTTGTSSTAVWTKVIQLTAGTGISISQAGNTITISASVSPVTEIIGTANQVLANGTVGSPQTGSVTLTLPQSIATTSSPTFAGLTLSSPLTIPNGGTGVTSVTIIPTASAWAGWDANSNFSAHNLLPGFNSTVSSGGNTILTVASAQTQEVTGSSTHTITMPVVSTLASGTPYKIINNSSSNVTINSSGGNAIQVMAANTVVFLSNVLTTGTTAASWNASYVFDNGAGVLSITGTADQVIASASTGPVTLSLPQSIATTSSPTFAALTLTAALTVPNGGSGRATATAYAVLCGGTTSTGAHQSIASVGTAGQVLTSNGAGALPTFQTGVNMLTDWVSYVPTFTGFGTPASNAIWSRRVGNNLEIRGLFVSGTSTAVEARMTLGYNGTNANVTSSTALLPSTSLAGFAAISVANAGSYTILIESNKGYITFGLQTSGNGGLTKQNGNSIIASTNSLSFFASIPIDTWP